MRKREERRCKGQRALREGKEWEPRIGERKLKEWRGDPGEETRKALGG